MYEGEKLKVVMCRGVVHVPPETPLGPYRTVPDRTVPDRTVPDRTVPYRTAPYCTAPHRTGPPRTVPYRTDRPVPYHELRSRVRVG